MAGAVYFVLAKLSFLTVLPAPPVGPALAWLPTGFAVAAILIEGYSIWPGIVFGSVLNSYPGTVGWGAVIGFVAVNTLDPLIAVWLPRRLLGRKVEFDNLRDVTAFILAVILVSSAFSATFGSIILHEIGGVHFGSSAITWLVWWVSDFIGVLILVPLLMVWRVAPNRSDSGAGPVEIIVGSVAGAAVTVFIFSMPLGHETLHFVYWFIPFVIWLGFRVGQRGLTMGVAILALVVISATSMGKGPFIGGSPEASFLYVQSFLAVVSILGLFLAAAIGERRRAIEARDDFFLRVSHELNTPLTVLGMQSFFLEELLGKNELTSLTLPQQKELVRINSKEIRRLMELVDDLLQGARIIAGKLVIVRNETDLLEVVRSVLNDHGDTIRTSGASINVHGESVRGVWDRKKLLVVVRSLLLNALKYGEGRPIEFSLRTEGRTATLVVEDHGIGIAPELRPKVFQPFGNHQHVRNFGGLGLELYISDAIVKAHGGRISMTDTPGGGATFRVVLPTDSNRP